MIHLTDLDAWRTLADQEIGGELTDCPIDEPYALLLTEGGLLWAVAKDQRFHLLEDVVNGYKQIRDMAKPGSMARLEAAQAVRYSHTALVTYLVNQVLQIVVKRNTTRRFRFASSKG